MEIYLNPEIIHLCVSVSGEGAPCAPLGTPFCRTEASNQMGTWSKGTGKKQ
jgi:hypothetical protein